LSVSGEEPFPSPPDSFSGGGRLVLETLGFEGEHPKRLSALNQSLYQAFGIRKIPLASPSSAIG
jgi:hypothetical protein